MNKASVIEAYNRGLPLEDICIREHLTIETVKEIIFGKKLSDYDQLKKDALELAVYCENLSEDKHILKKALEFLVKYGEKK